MHISNETLSEVQQRINIEEIISEFVTLKKKGSNLWGLCPFHNEKTPSFTVSTSKGFYKCFGCDAKGDAINFIMEIEGISFKETIIKLAQKYGIEIKTSTSIEREDEINKQSHKESLYILMAKAQELYENTLKNTEEAKKYILGRNITEESVKTFNIGYTGTAQNKLYRHLKSLSYEEDMLIEAGIINKKDSKIYDRFINRIIFPIHNISGNTIAFAGRLLDDNQNINSPKYINSPETTIYKKSQTLYGLYQAKNYIKQKDFCYLVEGYTDVISLHQKEVKNVVASAGTSLTQEQIILIKRFTNNITILFDGDLAGIKASILHINKLLENDINVNIVTLPTGEDPDSYANKVTKNELSNYLSTNVNNFIKFKTKLLMQDIKSDIIKKAEAIIDIVETISLIPNNIKKTLLLKECSQLLNIDEHTIMQEYRLIINKNKKYLKPDNTQEEIKNKPESNSTSNNSDIHLYEKEIIYLLLNYGHEKIESPKGLAQYIINEVRDIKFTTDIYNEIIDIYNTHIQNGDIIDIKNILSSQTHEVQKAMIDCLAKQYTISNMWVDKYQIQTRKHYDSTEQMAFKAILRLKLKIIQSMIIENQDKIKTEPDDNIQLQLLGIHKKLKDHELEIANKLGIVIKPY